MSNMKHGKNTKPPCKTEHTVNPLKTIWFFYNTHFPLTPSQIFLGLVFSGLIRVKVLYTGALTKTWLRVISSFIQWNRYHVIPRNTCDGSYQRRLNERWESVRLSCTKQMGSARSSMRIRTLSIEQMGSARSSMCIRTLSIEQMGSARSSMRICTLSILSTWDAPCDVNFVGGASVVCFVSFLIHRAIHTTLWTSPTSADHEQGAWSVTGVRSLVKLCAHFIVPLLGKCAMWHCLLFYLHKIIKNLILQTDSLNKKKIVNYNLKSF